MRTVLILAHLFVLGFVLSMAAGCSSQQRRSVAEDVIDCTIDVARAHSAEYGAIVEAALRAAVRPDGSVDWAAVRAAATGMTAEVGACTLAAVVVRMLEPSANGARAAPGPRGDELRAGWEALRRELWGGRRFRVEGGVL
jgi:hypothetical protein